jgi:putative drug exporter of the RND superfamily
MAAPEPPREPQTSLLARGIGAAVVALRPLVVAAWVAGAVLATLYLPTLHRSQGGALSDLVATNSRALRAEERSVQLFGAPLSADTMVVQRDPAGLPLAQQAKVVRRAIRIDQHRYPDLLSISLAVPLVNTLGIFPGSRERSTTAVTYLYVQPRYGFESANKLAHWFTERHIPPAASVVGVTGAGPARIAQYDAIQSALPVVTAATALLIALLIGLNFRAPGAPLVVLVACGIGYLVDVRVLAWISERAGISIPSEIEPLLVVLLLGITTDYAVFYLSAQRRRLLQGESPVEAARASGAALLPTILVAGLTVAGGTAAILAGRLDFIRAFGPGLALTALIGLLVATTFVPAALALFGRAVFWPSLGRREVIDEESESPRRRSLRARAAYWATARPLALLIVLVCVAGLGIAATGLTRTSLGFGLIGGLPNNAEARKAAFAAGAGFAPGILGPTEIVLEDSGIVGRTAELSRLEAALEQQSGVAGVIGPREQRLIRRPGVVVSKSGAAVRYGVILSSDPYEGPAIRHLRALERRLPRLLGEAGLGGTRYEVTGATAVASETIRGVVHDLARIAVVALIVDFLLLAIFLRALIAPLYLLAASVLALAATLGLTTYFFQTLLGYPSITYYVPFAVAVLLVSLGSDYNVFVTGRIWDEAKTRPLREAVAVAAPRAARAITVAGIVLAGSFALLAIIPLRSFAEFAFAMAVGVLIDSFVVRSFLVPALVSLVGTVGSWPGRRLRPREAIAPARA